MAKKETRIKIMKAGEELFSKEGYDGVSTKMIASEAKITEMTLFNHFENKELLYKSIVQERYLSLEIKSIFPELNYENLEKDLILISEKIILNYFNNRSILMMRLKEKESFHNDDIFKIENDPLLKQLIPIFNSYEKMDLIIIPGEKAAELFITMIKGIFHISLLDNKSIKEINSIIKDIIHIYCYGVIQK